MPHSALLFRMESPLLSSLIVFGSVALCKYLTSPIQKIETESTSLSTTVAERSNDRQWLTAREKGIRKGFYLEAPMEESNNSTISIFLGGGMN